MQFDSSDVNNNKGIVLVTAVLGCIPMVVLKALFFLPLLANGNSPYCRHFANQGLLLLILDLIFSAVGWVCSKVLSIVPLLGGVLSWLITGVLALIVLVFAIINAIHAANGDKSGIPIIGGIELIKS